MKITFEPKSEVPSQTYPCLRQAIIYPQIVFFISENTGIQIIKLDGKEPPDFGISSLWASAKDTAIWKPIHGTVTFEL